MSKVAMVTGGAVRLGKAIALSLADQGYDIVLHYNSSLEEAQKTAEEIRERNVACHLLQANLMAKDELSELIPRALELAGSMEVLVNSASIYKKATMMETSLEMFESNFAIHLRAPYFLTQSFAKHCRKGHIINIVDTKISFQQYVYSSYLLSKKALAELTQLAALELAPGIRVNAISPGVVLPPPTRTQDYIDWRCQGLPLQRSGSPKHVTHALRFLLENDFVTGQCIAVDGGEALMNEGMNVANFGGEKK